jgi:hypothetical protein
MNRKLRELLQGKYYIGDEKGSPRYLHLDQLSNLLNLELLCGDLRESKKIVPGTMLHADEITGLRKFFHLLRELYCFTADYPLYSLEGKKKKPTLWLAREPHHLVLRHLRNSEENGISFLEQLAKTGNYRPSSEEAQRVKQAKKTLQIDLTELSLQPETSEWSYFEIATDDYFGNLWSEEKKMMQRLLSNEKNYFRNMNLLQMFNVPTVKIYVLNPDYVREETEVGPLSRITTISCIYETKDKQGGKSNLIISTASRNGHLPDYLLGTPRD